MGSGFTKKDYVDLLSLLYLVFKLRTPDMPLDARNRRISIVVQNGS